MFVCKVVLNPDGLVTYQCDDYLFDNNTKAVFFKQKDGYVMGFVPFCSIKYMDASIKEDINNG